MALCYENGHGVEQNLNEAIKLYQQSAEKGNAKAQYKMGIFYKEGQGVEKSYTEAKNWLRKAAVQGYSKAIEELKSIENSMEIE